MRRLLKAIEHILNFPVVVLLYSFATFLNHTLDTRYVEATELILVLRDLTL